MFCSYEYISSNADALFIKLKNEYQVTDKQMIEASAASFLCDYSKMDEIFKAITGPRLEDPT